MAEIYLRLFSLCRRQWKSSRTCRTTLQSENLHWCGLEGCSALQLTDAASCWISFCTPCCCCLSAQSPTRLGSRHAAISCQVIVAPAAVAVRVTSRDGLVVTLIDWIRFVFTNPNRIRQTDCARSSTVLIFLMFWTNGVQAHWDVEGQSWIGVILFPPVIPLWIHFASLWRQWS